MRHFGMAIALFSICFSIGCSDEAALVDGAKEETPKDPTSIALVETKTVENGLSPKIAAYGATFGVVYSSGRAQPNKFVGFNAETGAPSGTNALPSNTSDHYPTIVAASNGFLTTTVGVNAYDDVNVFLINEDGTFGKSFLPGLTGVYNAIPLQRNADETGTFISDESIELGNTTTRAISLDKDDVATTWTLQEWDSHFWVALAATANEKTLLVSTGEYTESSSKATLLAGPSANKELRRIDLGQSSDWKTAYVIPQVGKTDDNLWALWNEWRCADTTDDGAECEADEDWLLSSRLILLDADGYMTKNIDLASIDSVAWTGKYFVGLHYDAAGRRLQVAAFKKDGTYLTGQQVPTDGDIPYYSPPKVAALGNEIGIVWAELVTSNDDAEIEVVKFAHLTIK